MHLVLDVSDVELDEGAGQALHFPGRGRLAGTEANDRAADPDRLARPQGQVPRQSVTFVEESQHRDPLGHRRRPGRKPLDRLGNVYRVVLGFGRILLVALLGAPRTAAGEQKKTEETKGRQAGVHRLNRGLNRASRPDSRRSRPGAGHRARALRTDDRPSAFRSDCRSRA